MGRLSCLPACPHPFHSASQEPAQTRGVWGIRSGRAAPAPRAGNELGGEERSAPSHAREGASTQHFGRRSAVISSLLLHQTPTASGGLPRRLAGRAALPGSRGCQRAALALAASSCFSSKAQLPQGGFRSLGLPSRRTHAAAGGGGGPGQRFGRAFQEEVDFHSFEAQLRTCITLPAPFWGRHMFQPGSATPASLGAGGRLGQAGLWSPRLQLGLSLLPAGPRAPDVLSHFPIFS